MGGGLVKGLAASSVCLAAIAACLLTVGFSSATFTYSTRNPQTISAAADFLAPSASASAIAKAQGGTAGYVRAGGAYFVYANVTDSGSPASGVASVKANVSALTSGQTAVTLQPGSYSLGGVTYSYRSVELKVGSGIAAGVKSYSLALSDSAGNAHSQSFSVTVDNTPLAGSSLATANDSGGTSGKPEKGDSVTFTFNEAPEPGSIVPGWTGTTAATVSVSIADTGSSDTLTVNGSAATLGSVALQANYTTAGKNSTFTGSTMTLSGSTLKIVLGSEPAGNARTETTKRAFAWTPSSSIYDQAGNACSTAPVTSANVRQF